MGFACAGSPEPALDQVQPRGTRRGNVQMKLWMLRTPGVHIGMAMRSVVVQDQSSRVPQKYRGTYQNRLNTVKIKGNYSGGHHHDATKQDKIPSPHSPSRKANGKPKMFSCWTRSRLLLSRMNHDRRHGSCGRAQRVEDIGHKPSVSSEATSPWRGMTPWVRQAPSPASSPATLRWNPLCPTVFDSPVSDRRQLAK